MNNETQSTHYDKCYREHHVCALARIAELEGENRGLKDVIRQYGVMVRKAAALLLNVEERDLKALRKKVTPSQSRGAVHHIDGDPGNNSLDNLEIRSIKEH